MTDESDNRSYPRIPAKIWWLLRTQAKRAVPRSANTEYIHTVVGLGEGTASNIAGSLRAIGLVDEKFAPTPLFHEWRDDDSYAEACKKIVDSIYPADLTSALPGPDPDRSQVSRWFQRRTKTGEAAAGQMSAFYLLLAKADVSTGAQDVSSSAQPKRKVTKMPNVSPRRAEKASAHTGVPEPRVVEPERPAKTPSVHIDVQIHIPPQATAEQIDQIFASMAKHLYQAK